MTSRVVACDSETCTGKTPEHARLFHLIIAAETELAERDGRPVPPIECANAVPTDESRAMAQRILNAPPKTATELAEQAAHVERVLALYAARVEATGGVQ